jgi:hypothetical protein
MPKFAWPENVTEERGEQIAAIVWAIYEQGPIEDENGRATGVLMSLLKEQGLDISVGWLNKTLTDLEDGGAFGHFIDRDINGKRTYGITCVRKPGRDPFPPDPREPADPANELVDLVEEDEFEEEVEVVGDIDLPERVPGMEMELLPAPSRVDRYLYIVSLLNEMVTEEITAPERQFEARLDERLTAVNGILEENVRLKKENDGLRDDKRKLAAALEQASAMMRDHAGRATNGARENVSTSA